MKHLQEKIGAIIAGYKVGGHIPSNLKSYFDTKRISLFANYLLIAATVGLTFALDLLSPFGTDAEFLYILPIFLTLSIPANKTLFMTASICTILAEIGYYFSSTDISNVVTTSNRALVLIVIWVTAFLVVKEKKHKALASHLSSIVADSNDAIFSVDRRGKITSWNEAAELLYEYTAEEVMGKHVNILYHYQNNVASSFQFLKRKLKQDGILKNYEVKRVSKNGILRFISISMSPLKDSKDNVIGYSKIDRDITEEKLKTESLQQAKKEAESANAAKGLFLANVSHEIRTPLAAILGYADRLYYNENNLEERKEFINIIRRNSAALLGLINDLLDVSKIESDQLEIEIEAFSLESLLNEVVSLMKQRAAEKGIELTVAISGKIPNQISTDRLRLRQILINLISNAIKFTKKGFVEIQVAYDNENSKVIFSVKDTGCGIKTERQQNLFLPFMQGDSSIRREYGGSGLGLYLSKKLATFLNSKLYLKNSVVDNGSVFSLEVPVGEIKKLEFTENLSTSPLDSEYDVNLFPTKGLEKQSILIVEDVKENRDLFEFYLKRAGAEVVTAVDGEDGIEKIKTRHYDLVFMDLQMPKIDGYKAIEIIKQEKLFDGPVIALTAHAMRGEREKCIQAGFGDHLSKPVSAKNLVAFAKNFLKNRSTKEVESSNTIYSNSESFQKDTLEIENSFKGNLPPPVKKAIRHFVEHIPESVEAIQEACRSNDKVRVKSLIHSFKGSAGVCGFTQLFTELEKLEVEVDADFQSQEILKVLKKIRSSEKKLSQLYIA